MNEQILDLQWIPIRGEGFDVDADLRINIIPALTVDFASMVKVAFNS